MTSTSTRMDLTSEPSPMSRDDAIAHVLRADPRFEIVDTTLWGNPFTVFARAPDNLRTLLQEAVASYPQRELLVYGQERWTVEEFASAVNRTRSCPFSLATVLPWPCGITLKCPSC